MAGPSRAVRGEVGWPYEWRVIGVQETTTIKRTVAGTEREFPVKSDVQISIHDIPEERFGDALKHMSDHYLQQDFLCRCYGLKADQTAVNNFHGLWTYILLQKMSIGAFRVNPDGTLGELVGMNLLYVPTDVTENWIRDFTMRSTSAAFCNMFTFLRYVSARVDIRKDYGADNYLAAMGLSVQPTGFNVQEMTVQLLETRKDIGKIYGITVTSGFFTDSMAQFQANQAGFQTALAMKYAEVLDDNRKPVFLNVGVEEIHLMVNNLVNNLV